MNEKWMKLDEKWMTWMQFTLNLFSVKLNSPIASFFPSHSTSAASQSQVQLETFEPFSDAPPSPPKFCQHCALPPCQTYAFLLEKNCRERGMEFVWWICVMNWSGLEEDPGRFLVGGDLGVKDWVSVLHDVGAHVELVEDDVLCFLKQN